MIGQVGREPAGLRVLSDLRLDGAGGDFEYGRASLDLTLMQGLFGPYGASLTLGAGTSVGDVPLQHLYYLGGSATVRGQSIGANAGNAYWLTRFEFGKGLAARRVLFADFGWAGDREHLSEVGRPLSGVGVGLSFLDGLMRFDIARGIYPEKQFRFTLYMDSKF
jgi:hemolysin activation/secretion protein